MREGLTYENQGSITYLVYEVGENETIDSMSLGMLANNKIPGLAQTMFTQMNSSKYIKFNVSGKIAVSQMFMGIVNKKRLLGVFDGIVDAMLAAEDYMLDTRNILIDMDYIYTDVSTCETILVCLPVATENAQTVDLGMFFRNVMFNTQFDQTENCDYVAKIISFLNSSPVFSLGDFQKLLTDLGNGGNGVAPAPAVQQRPVAPQVQQVPPVVSAPQPSVAPVQPAPQVSPVPPVAPAQPVPPVQPVPPTPQPVPQPVKPAVPPMQPVPNNGPQNRVAPPNMAVPPQQMPNQPIQNQNGKDMSWFYLMQHYNKDNAAIYKAQKEAKKQRGKTPANAMPPYQAPGMAVPGQPVPPNGQRVGQPGAPVPGMPQALGMPPAPGMAIPGQVGQPVPPMNMPPQQKGKGKKVAPMPAPVPQVPPMGAAPMPAPVPAPAPAPMQKPVQATPVQPATPPVYTPPVAPAPQPAQSMDFGDTMLLGGESFGETTVLNDDNVVKQANMPHLIRIKNNEKILLNKPVFRLGREQGYVDYVISDNPVVGRSHANIIVRDGEAYVVDTNSKNHTYLNDRMLQSNVETMLSHGDKVRLANEEFEFKRY